MDWKATGEKKECKHCGKKHHGKCWSLDSGASKHSHSKNQKFQKNTGFSKAQFATMKKLMSSKSSTRTIDTESSSDDESASQHSWAKGVNLVQQMYISQAYKRDNGMDSDEEVVEIPEDELKALKKKARRASKSMGRRK